MVRLTVCLLGGVVVFAAVTALGSRKGGPVTASPGRRIDRDKARAWSLVVMGVAVSVLISRPGLAVVFGPLGWLGGAWAKRAAAQRRRQRMEQQLPDALGLIGNAMSAGFSLLQSLGMVAREVPAPLGAAFRKSVGAVNLGVDVTQAMEQIAAEMQSEDFDTVVMAVTIQRRTGGNLPRILEVVAATIRERQRLNGKIKSLTAQGRLTAVVVALLPLVLIFVMSKMMPEYIAPLFEQRLGQVLLVLSGVSELIGLWMVNRISQLNY